MHKNGYGIKVFLLDSYRSNAGSNNVNKFLLESSSYDFLHIEKRRRNIRIVEILHKKIIYLMHGCVTNETQINKLNVKKKILNFEKGFLQSVDLVLLVSEQYKNWVTQRFPSTEKKIHFLSLRISGADPCYR